MPTIPNFKEEGNASYERHIRQIKQGIIHLVVILGPSTHIPWT